MRTNWTGGSDWHEWKRGLAIAKATWTPILPLKGHYNVVFGGLEGLVLKAKGGGRLFSVVSTSRIVIFQPVFKKNTAVISQIGKTWNVAFSCRHGPWSHSVENCFVTGAMFLKGFRNMIFRGRHNTLEMSMCIFGGRRSTLDLWCCSFCKSNLNCCIK